MKGFGYPPTKIELGIIVVFLLLIFGGTIANWLKPQLDTVSIQQGQADVGKKVDALTSEIIAVKYEIQTLKTGGANKADIMDLQNRLDKLENQIANINSQVVQDINLTNINTYVNNYNIRMIFNITVAFLVVELLKLIYFRWQENRKITINQKIYDEKQHQNDNQMRPV